MNLCIITYKREKNAVYVYIYIYIHVPSMFRMILPTKVESKNVESKKIERKMSKIKCRSIKMSKYKNFEV
jgi:hypothetical protein